MINLNHALSDKGYFLEIKENYKFKKVLVIYYLFTGDLDENILNDLSNDHQIIFTLEEGAEIGGFGSNVLNYYSKYKNSPRVVIKGVEDNFVTHASRNELLSELGLDEEGVLNHILTSLKKYE